jgi:hypothetical protein
VPSSLLAVVCGVTIVGVNGAGWLSVQVLLPLALFVATTLIGVAISAPGYTRLLAFASQHGADHPYLASRMRILAWANRIELVLVVGAGFTTLASAIPV